MEEKIHELWNLYREAKKEPDNPPDVVFYMVHYYHLRDYGFTPKLSIQIMEREYLPDIYSRINLEEYMLKWNQQLSGMMIGKE